MKIIHQSFEVLDDYPLKDINKRIELIGRVCYKSENHITDYSAEKFVEKIISNGHESVLEHISFCFEIKVKSEYVPRFFLFANYIHDSVVGFHSNVVDTSQGDMTAIISFNLRTLRDMACLTTLTNLLVKDILIKVYSLCPALIKDRFTTDDFRLCFLDSIKWQNPDEFNLPNYYRHKYVTVRFIMDRGISHELVRHRISSYCISADSILPAYYGNKKWSIEQLFRWQFDVKRKGRIKLIRLRSVNQNGIIVPNGIKQIYDSGVQDVYEVATLTGRKIKTTLNHRFYTPEGYKKLCQISVGDKIFANGISLLDNDEYIKRRYLVDNLTRKELASEIGCCETLLYRAFQKFGIVKPLSNRPNRVAGHGNRGMFIDEQRKLISLRMTGSKNHRWKGSDVSVAGARTRCYRNFTPDVCCGCGALHKLERHHFDNNPKNNEKKNIYFVCSKCHKAFHRKDIRGVFSDEVVSIEFVGKQQTYDIEMMDEPHNFVSNGIVTHNSQESTRYVNYNKSGVSFIIPVDFELNDEDIKLLEMMEDHYNKCINNGRSPQQARYFLPNGLKTEIIMTANMGEWMHVLKLRTKKGAHPQMISIMNDLKEAMYKKITKIL